MVRGVSKRLFSVTVSLVLVFFFFWVIEGVIFCRGDRISTLRIFRGVFRQEGGQSFSLSSSMGESGGAKSSASILASNSQILLPMMSRTSSFSSDSSLSFSRMRLKLSLNSMKSWKLSSPSGLGASRNSATWIGELKSLSWWLPLLSGLMPLDWLQFYWPYSTASIPASIFMQQKMYKVVKSQSLNIEGQATPASTRATQIIRTGRVEKMDQSTRIETPSFQ